MQVSTKSARETISLGKKIAKCLKGGDFIALFGNLGSGKTTFAKGIAEGLGIDKKTINSPSFVLLKEHKGKVPFYHFDLYRIKNLSEVFDIGYEEYLSSCGIIAVEWADRIKDILPKKYLRINFLFINENERLLKFTSHGSYYKNIVGKICRS